MPTHPKGSVNHFRNWLSQAATRTDHLPDGDKFIKAFIENKDNKSEQVIELVFTWPATRQDFNRYLHLLTEYDDEWDDNEIVDIDGLIFTGEREEFNHYLDYLFQQKAKLTTGQNQLTLVKQKLTNWNQLLINRHR